MDGELPPSDPSFERVVAWIEDRLDGPLTLEAIARRAGLSPYHFSRLFTARMGRSVMFHVRLRRLVRAARRLASDPQLRLVDLALDCGFESQEAFTRAFKRTFGVSPGRFRRAQFQSEGKTMSAAIAPGGGVRVERLPGLVLRETFSVAGFSQRFDEVSKAGIPDLWTRLVQIMPFPGQIGWETFGVVWSVNREDTSFSYLAAGGLQADAPTPEGMERKDIPAAEYAVFRITLDGGAIPPQVSAAMRLIWGDLIPASGLVVAETPDFEVYDGRFEPDQPGAVIDYHVPVRR